MRLLLALLTSALMLSSAAASFEALEWAVEAMSAEPELCDYEKASHELVPVPDCAARLCSYPDSVCRYGIDSDRWDCWPIPQACRNFLQAREGLRLLPNAGGEAEASTGDSWEAYSEENFEYDEDYEDEITTTTSKPPTTPSSTTTTTAAIKSRTTSESVTTKISTTEPTTTKSADPPTKPAKKIESKSRKKAAKEKTKSKISSKKAKALRRYRLRLRPGLKSGSAERTKKKSTPTPIRKAKKVKTKALQTTKKPKSKSSEKKEKPKISKKTKAKIPKKRIRLVKRGRVGNSAKKRLSLRRFRLKVRSGTRLTKRRTTAAKGGRDYHQWCCYWAAMGDCQSSPYVRVVCQGSCGSRGCSFADWRSCPVSVDPACSNPSEELKRRGSEAPPKPPSPPRLVQKKERLSALKRYLRRLSPAKRQRLLSLLRSRAPKSSKTKEARKGDAKSNSRRLLGFRSAAKLRAIHHHLLRTARRRAAAKRKLRQHRRQRLKSLKARLRRLRRRAKARRQ